MTAMTPSRGTGLGAGAAAAGRAWWARWTRPPHLVGMALWLVMAAAVILTARGVLMVDTKPEVYLAPWRTFRSFLSPWQADPQLGFPSFNVGLAPVAGLVGLLQ